MAPGQCWAFKGSRGQATIKLLTPVRICGVTLEHISKSISPSGEISTAPKDFSIWVAFSSNWLNHFFITLSFFFRELAIWILMTRKCWDNLLMILMVRRFKLFLLTIHRRFIHMFYLKSILITVIRNLLAFIGNCVICLINYYKNMFQIKSPW